MAKKKQRFGSRCTEIQKQLLVAEAEKLKVSEKDLVFISLNYFKLNYDSGLISDSELQNLKRKVG